MDQEAVLSGVLRKPVNNLAGAMISIVVGGELEHYRVVEDLEDALSLRHGMLLTYRAEVVNRASLRVSSLQPVVDRCVLPMLVSAIQDADGFVKTYEDRAAVRAMNGKVTVPGEGGRVEIQIRASKALRYQLREPQAGL